VNSDEPEVRKPGAKYGIDFLVPLEPVEDVFSSPSARSACGGLVMDAFFEMQNPPGRGSSVP
jgi:hypothetical protein